MREGPRILMVAGEASGDAQAARLAADAAVFQDQGRTAIEAAERERLAGAYAALPDAMAKEVAAWLAATDTRRV